MTVDDRTRLNLHRKLEAVLGPEEADTLMAHLPPVTWQNVATKDDLRVLGAELRHEMADLRTELRTEMADLCREMADLRTDVTRAIQRQTQWMTGFIVAWSTAIVAAIRLLS